jgi:hypothetical protein
MVRVACNPFMLSVIMLSVVMLSAVMLSVIMLIVVMLIVVAPQSLPSFASNKIHAKSIVSFQQKIFYLF